MRGHGHASAVRTSGDIAIPTSLVPIDSLWITQPEQLDLVKFHYISIGHRVGSLAHRGEK